MATGHAVAAPPAAVAALPAAVAAAPKDVAPMTTAPVSSKATALLAASMAAYFYYSF